MESDRLQDYTDSSSACGSSSSDSDSEMSPVTEPNGLIFRTVSTHSPEDTSNANDCSGNGVLVPHTTPNHLSPLTSETSRFATTTSSPPHKETSIITSPENPAMGSGHLLSLEDPALLDLPSASCGPSARDFSGSFGLSGISKHHFPDLPTFADDLGGAHSRPRPCHIISSNFAYCMLECVECIEQGSDRSQGFGSSIIVFRRLSVPGSNHLHQWYTGKLPPTTYCNNCQRNTRYVHANNNSQGEDVCNFLSDYSDHCLLCGTSKECGPRTPQLCDDDFLISLFTNKGSEKTEDQDTDNDDGDDDVGGGDNHDFDNDDDGDDGDDEGDSGEEDHESDDEEGDFEAVEDESDDDEDGFSDFDDDESDDGFDDDDESDDEGFPKHHDEWDYEEDSDEGENDVGYVHEDIDEGYGEAADENDNDGDHEEEENENNNDVHSDDDEDIEEANQGEENNDARSRDGEEMEENGDKQDEAKARVEYQKEMFYLHYQDYDSDDVPDYSDDLPDDAEESFDVTDEEVFEEEEGVDYAEIYFDDEDDEEEEEEEEEEETRDLYDDDDDW